MEAMTRAHEWARLLAGVGDRWREVVPVDARPVREVDGKQRDALDIGGVTIYRVGAAWWVREQDGRPDVGYQLHEPVSPDPDTHCAEEGCGHPRYQHTGRGGRCTEGRQKDTAAWRCDCAGFVEPEPKETTS